MQKKASEDNEANAFDTAFDNRISEIEPDFLQGVAFNTSFLLSRYKLHLKNYNYSNYEGYRFERLKNRLQKYFQDKLIVHQTEAANEPDLIYYSQVNLQTVINKLAYLKKETKLEAIKNYLELPQEDSDISDLFYTALPPRMQ